MDLYRPLYILRRHGRHFVFVFLEGESQIYKGTISF